MDKVKESVVQTKQLEVKFGDKTLYMNIDDWKAQKNFRKQKERALIRNARRLFST